jgi:hypothetical protein
MKFAFEQPIRAGRDLVEEALLDPDFYAALASMPNVGVPEVLDQTSTDGTVTLRVRYAFTGELAAPARAVLDPAKLTWVIESTTEPSEHSTRFRMIPDNYANRLQCDGVYRFLDESAALTRQVVEGNLIVHFPLVSRIVERAILSGLQQHVASQATALEQWASTDRSKKRT